MMADNPIKHPGQTSLEQDYEFLERAGRHLNINKWGEFLMTWTRSLESYGTPRSFVDSTRYESAKVKFGDQEYPFVYAVSANYAQRSALMDGQEKYPNQEPEDAYGLELNLDSCFLCQNVAQAIDAENHPDEVLSNMMYDFGSHFILPNRYPAQFGHSLSVPKDHDDLSDRVLPQAEHDLITDTKIYYPESGKTRGSLLKREYLTSVLDSCDELGLVGIRNHVLDGMSIPGHDHFHLMPEDLLSLIESIIGGLTETGYGRNIFMSQNTPFDTLLIRADGGEAISEIAIPILERMERADQVFTLAYGHGHLLISPRFKDEVGDRMQKIGGGIPLHYFDTEGEEFVERVKRVVPMSGQYNWSDFI